MKPLPLPEGFHNVNAYLVVEDPDALVQFLINVFGAQIGERFTFEGRTTHAEARIGDAIVMIGGARNGTPAPAMLYVYVDDCDAAYERAILAGAESIMPPADMYYGDRHGGVRDQSGNSWWIATHIEDVSADELARRHEIEQRRRRSGAPASTNA
ncbi:MAG TPA: VOC family protein [Candidatus Baltobacteraceae bacterium]|nr:VOC family protein [Candidatus Baltobacteraceae bacterium]